MKLNPDALKPELTKEQKLVFKEMYKRMKTYCDWYESQGCDPKYAYDPAAKYETI